MTKKKERSGRCRICGKFGKLSFEHVPNEAAFNSQRVIEYSWEDKVIPREEQAKGKIKQKGMGDYTLCEKCNNDTGHWYGDEYTSWARTCFNFLARRRPSSEIPDEAELTLHDVYPLRFLKQVVVCFFSVSPGLAQSHSRLVNFVLKKHEKHMPEGCQIYMNFYYGRRPILRRWPIASKITVQYSEGKLVPIAGNFVSEMAHPPFALVMAYDTGFTGAGNITRFRQFDYDQRVKNLTLRLQVLKGASIYPGSFQ